MFSGYEPKRGRGKGRYLASGVTALAIYAGLGVTVFALAANRPPEEEPTVDVSFHEPPPSAPAPAPPPPAAAATPSPPKVKTPRRPTPELTEPKRIPDQPLPEAEPSQAADPGPPGPSEQGSPTGVEGGTPGGTGTGPPSPVPPAPPAPRPRSVPQNLPDGAIPAEPDGSNATPEFPEAARAKGVEGLVILKIVVSETGAVKDVQVMKGEEPFVAAALAAVKTWRYRPASFQGAPIAVFKIVKVPFKLSGR
jgi:periplasmic protein TonB